ncbi:MAG: CTP synthase [Candidatus Thermoplasmatota archaeon]|nr:CTP synthase [Candidatus Thermoplasmatota archaeon]
MTKFIFVTGGVMSGLGKGVVTSSLGKLLKAKGFSVTAIKIDPYLNCDAGTMNPFEHGEVFVLDDGTEVDLDLGNYERFLDVDLCGKDNITTGKVYRSVIEKERSGEYLGKTVQIIPHITDEINRRIWDVAEDTEVDIVLIELGGTVGDIESMPFLEAVRQLHMDVGEENNNSLFVHTTLIPVLEVVGEQKTKPTQHSVKALREIGIEPDIIVGRSEERLEESTKKKISLFCDVPKEAVISSPNANNIYRVPLILDDEGLTECVMDRLHLYPKIDEEKIPKNSKLKMEDWKKFLEDFENPTSEIDIALVGKYTDLEDAYVSHEQALNHCRAETRTEINIDYVESEDLEDKNVVNDLLGDIDGILIPGGFGDRGIEGKINAINYARVNDLPILAICLGFQLSVVEFARNILGYEEAHSYEFDEKTPDPVIDLLPMQRGIDKMGGTMRLGAEKIVIEEGTKVHDIYKKSEIMERHRHRYEVNLDYKDEIEAEGMCFSAQSPNGKRMEILELEDHPFFIGTQFHPEFLSRPMKPAPVFLRFVESMIEDMEN